MIRVSPRVSPSSIRTIFVAAMLLPSCAATVRAQEKHFSDANYRSSLQQQLTFESGLSENVPDGWTGNSPTIFVDRKIFHAGHSSVRFDRSAQAVGNFSAITKSVPIDFTGNTLELRGFLRTSDVAGMVGLWMREDGATRALKFDNMRSQHVSGTHDWAEYSITLPLDPRASTLVFGVLLAGTGTAWADDLRLLVDGKPLWDVPSVERPKSILETDHEFDGGSGVRIDTLSKLQIDNLVTLARVWGFLKYHHPAVTGGTKQWDFELFRILPSVLNASTTAQADQILADWIDKLGPVPTCTACAHEVAVDSQMKPHLQWISDKKQFGVPLSQRLTHIYRERTAGNQFYVQLVPEAGNPDFGAERAYKNLKLPDAGYQVLALYRYWNIIEYWYPNRDLIDEDWVEVLKKSIPVLALAKSEHDYQRGLLELIAHVHDTHSNVWNSLNALPPEGKCEVRAAVRFVGQRAVVSRTSGELTNLERGDTIAGIDGVSLAQLLSHWKPYYPASNEPTQLRDIGRNLLRGACGTAKLDIQRDGATLHVESQRVPIANPDRDLAAHDLRGDTFRLLSSDVAYLKLSSVKARDVAGYIKAAADTKGLIVDIRNYPSDFVPFALGQLLVDKDTEFARFTNPDLANPGAFKWTDSMKLVPQAPHYAGKIMILVDESTQSQAEYTAMALRSSPRAIVIGSTTAGADGNVSFFMLPGNLRTAISGIGVFYPDKRPTQRVGIVPDIFVTPTIKGLREGADEVLERALREILGKHVSDAELRKLYRRH